MLLLPCTTQHQGNRDPCCRLRPWFGLFTLFSKSPFLWSSYLTQPTMRFSLSTPMLSAGLIFLLFLQAVNSLSVSNRGPESQSLTFPLKRIQQRSDIHPQIVRDKFPIVLNTQNEQFCSSCKCTSIAVFIGWQRCPVVPNHPRRGVSNNALRDVWVLLTNFHARRKLNLQTRQLLLIRWVLGFSKCCL